MKNHPTRISVRSRMIVFTLALLLATVSLTSCARGGDIRVAGSGACPTIYKIKFQVYPGSVVNLWPDVADQQGYFAKHCIQATGQIVNSGPAALAQLAAGDLQTMMSTPDNFIQARANGFKLKMVATAATRASLGFVVANKFVTPGMSVDDAVKSLRGKSIGVNSQGSQMQYFAAAMLKQHGVDPKDVKFVGLGTPSSMLASLQRDNVQAAVFDSQYTDMVTSLGFATKYADMRYPTNAGNLTPMPEAFQAMEGMASSYAFTDEFLAKYPDAAKGWRDAIAEAADFAGNPDNRSRVRDIVHQAGRVVITEATPNAQQIFNTAVDAAAASSKPHAAMNPDLLQKWIDWTAAARKIADPPKAADLIWNG
ncbi:ABC transporter substrate-binding protein [Pseudarthrobacter sp. H2]|uniref:ABC transporter substrate-binding protein n=1 Tax=Pseudarthrobacter sp. H2 TaxID=3418415 RepID=UPI003CFBB4BC